MGGSNRRHSQLVQHVPLLSVWSARTLSGIYSIKCRESCACNTYCLAHIFNSHNWEEEIILQTINLESWWHALRKLLMGESYHWRSRTPKMQPKKVSSTTASTCMFTLGKSSQRRFPIKKFDNLLHINIAGVLFAKTHYSSCSWQHFGPLHA